jgi:WD40 repeated domain
MFGWLKSLFSTNEEDCKIRFVAKDQGHRGPLLDLVPLTILNEPVCACVTPSCIFVVFWCTSAKAVGKRLSLPNDAFVCACKSSTGEISVGTQNGSIIIVKLTNTLAFETQEISRCNSPIASIARTDNFIVAGLESGKLVVLNLVQATDSWQKMGLLDIGVSAISAVCIVDNLVWCGRSDGKIFVMDLSVSPISVVKENLSLSNLAIAGIKYVKAESVILVLHGCQDLSVWNITDFSVLHQYQANLVTCGSYLSCLEVVDSTLFLGSTDGSFCLRVLKKRVEEDQTHKFQCILLRYWEARDELDSSPISSAAYDPDSQTILIGDAGCRVRSVKKR